MKETTRHSLKACLPADRLFWQESLAEHTSFRCGGPAACLARVINTEELRQVLRLLREEDEAHFVLGRGTNVLADDAGYEGVIVQVAEGFDDIRREGDTIVAEGGAPLMRAAAFARDCGLSGLEFACGIPGTVGGGVVMNAGAYGGEMCRMVESAVLLLEDGTERICSTKELEFGYRTSLLKTLPAVVTSVTFALTPADPESIRAKMEELLERRRQKQPLEYPSAGSTFKRPEGYFAGALIEEAGLRGATVGGAQVSEKHCGFVINRGGATAADVKELIAQVQETVRRQSGVVLEREIIYL